MKSVILKLGTLCLMICSSLFVELAFEGNRFTKTNALIAINIALVVYIVVCMLRQPRSTKTR